MVFVVVVVLEIIFLKNWTHKMDFISAKINDVYQKILFQVASRMCFIMILVLISCVAERKSPKPWFSHLDSRNNTTNLLQFLQASMVPRKREVPS